MATPKVLLGDRITELRKAKGWSQSDLAAVHILATGTALAHA